MINDTELLNLLIEKTKEDKIGWIDKTSINETGTHYETTLSVGTNQACKITVHSGSVSVGNMYSFGDTHSVFPLCESIENYLDRVEFERVQKIIGELIVNLQQR